MAWERLLYTFHTDEALQDMVDEVLRSARYYLKWQDSAHGQGYAAARIIPKLTRFCYYGGALAILGSATLSNHRITLGRDVGGFPYFVEIDGCTTASAGVEAETPGLLQMVNHSCNPNCRIEAVGTASGIELLILEARDNINEGEEITIDYDAQASLTSKQRGLTFWQWMPPISSVQQGLRRIKCGCAGPGRNCPNGLWRDEHENRRVDTMARHITTANDWDNETGQHSNTNGQQQLQTGSSPSIHQLGKEAGQGRTLRPAPPCAADAARTKFADSPEGRRENIPEKPSQPDTFTVNSGHERREGPILDVGRQRRQTSSGNHATGQARLLQRTLPSLWRAAEPSAQGVLAGALSSASNFLDGPGVVTVQQDLPVTSMSSGHHKARRLGTALTHGRQKRNHTLGDDLQRPTRQRKIPLPRGKPTSTVDDRTGNEDQERVRTDPCQNADGMNGSGDADDGAGRGCESREAVGMDGGTTEAYGNVVAAAGWKATTQQQKELPTEGSADRPRRRESGTAGSSTTQCRKEADEGRTVRTWQSRHGGVTFPRSLRNLGNTCFFNATMQALASIPEIVRDIVTLQPTELPDDTSLIITYLQRYLPYISRGSRTPNDALQWEEIHARGRQTTTEDWLDFVWRATSWGDRAFRKNMVSDAEDLLRTFLAILPSVNAMFSFEVITNIQCVCGKNRVNGRSQVSTSTQHQIYDTVILPQSDETSLVARIRQCFATELVEGYRCPDCKALSTQHHPTTLQRSICLLPEYLLVSIAKPSLRTRRPHGQNPFELRDFDHLDLSGIASMGGPAQSQYTLCAAILFSEQHYWTYLHGPPAFCVNDSCSRLATEKDLCEVARCARILFYRKDSSSHTAMDTISSGLNACRATLQDEALEGRMGASAPPQGEAGGGLQALQEEVDTLLRQTIQCYGHEWTDSAEPLLGLWSRLSQYQSVCDHIVAWTSCTPAMPRTPDFPPLRPSPKAITAGTAELPARLQNAWVAALPVDRLQRARGIVSEMSSVIRRQLWSLEQAMFDSLRVIHDLSTEQQLEEFQTLDTAITGAAEWHPALHWYGSDRRVQCLRGLRFLQVAPRAHEYDPVDWESALPGDEPRRKRAARYLASLRRAISPEVVELVESMQQKHTGRFYLPAVISNYRHTIQTWMRGDELLAGVVLSLDLPGFRAFFETRAAQVHAASPSTSAAPTNDHHMVEVDRETGRTEWRARERAPVSIGLSTELVLPGTTHMTQCGQSEIRVESKSTGIAHQRAKGQPGHNRTRKARIDSTSHKSTPERTSTALPTRLRQFTLADFFNGSAAPACGPTMHGLAHPAQSLSGKHTDGTASNDERCPLEIPKPGQNDTILARPQEQGGSAQAGHAAREDGIPPGTTAVTGIDQRSCGQPPHAPFYDRMIHECGVVQTREAWSPGTDGLYPRPRGALPPNELSTRLPLWNPRMDGVRRQRAMFDIADRLSPSGAFYVAADVWTKKNGKDWGLGKVFGAFQNVYAFILQLLEIAPHRCFYEIIREDRACKAYFDLEASPGAMTKEEGARMCNEVVQKWAARIRARWPRAEQETPRCLEPMILNGSRATDQGWKVSYHIIYPWLTFSCNTTMLRDEVTRLSDDPSLQYNGPGGIQRFIDPAVYTRNRQFRLPLCYKLSDRSRTGLSLPSPPLLSTFGRACISRIEIDSWRVPEEPVPADLRPAHNTRRTSRDLAPTNDTCMLDWAQLAPLTKYLYQLLRRQGHPEGRLTPQGHKFGKETFRWEVSPGRRPCMVAQQWRSSDPTHDSNAAMILVDGKGAVYLKCLHPECAKWRYMDYIDTVPSHIFAASTDYPERPGCSSGRAQKRGRNDCRAQHTRQRRRKTSELEDTNMSESASASPSAQESTPRCEQPRAPTTSNSTLSWRQSCRRVHEENQADDDEALTAWHIPALPFGGRMGNSVSDTTTASRGRPASAEPAASDAPDGVDQNQDVPDDANESISAWLDSPPFTQPAPPQLITAVREELISANGTHAQTCGDFLPGWKDVTDREVNNRPVPSLEAGSTAAEIAQWGIQPDSEWFQHPIAQRPPVGHSLVQTARERVINGLLAEQLTPNAAATPDLWATPFRVGYLNVGYRRFRLSLEGVAALVKQQRPDILFLGDMGSSRDQVGRLRQRIEAELDDEWFLWTDTSAPPGYPVGMGAVIHCSLAQHISKVELPCPPEVNRDIWTRAVEGRLMQLEVSRPELRIPWRFIGIYQHVAKRASRNIAEADLVRHTLDCILEQTSVATHHVLLLGDVNAAPIGGRWGYSNRNPALHQVDLKTLEWVRTSGLTEVADEPLQATWRPNLLQKRAVLDRAFLYARDAPLARLRVHWAEPSILFDHAMILVNLPYSEAGMGFAGACPPLMPRRQQGLKINLNKWTQPQCREEWARLLQNCLEADEEESLLQNRDPFLALKNAELLAESIAERLAPKRSSQLGETTRSFRFPGHRRLCREIDILQHARQLVHKVVGQSSDIMHCPHRVTRWELSVLRHAGRTWGSGFGGPPRLGQSTAWYFTQAAQRELMDWMDQAKIAIEARWASIREDYAKARCRNLQNLRRKLMKQGFLDARTSRTALGIRQPKRRMFAISGKVATGVRLGTEAQMAEVLDVLAKLPEAGAAVQLLGTSYGLQVWFRGPQPLGNFLVAWCGHAHVRDINIVMLYPQSTFVAITPDDMLSVQELHLASEGMDTASICPTCKGREIQPISTSAEGQRYGNPNRAIRFFCARCQRVVDQVELPPLADCPVPLEVWNSLRKIPPGTAPLLAKPVDFDTLLAIVRRLVEGKSPGSDGFLREFYKYGPTALIALLQAAINAFIAGQDPTVNPEEWLGALVALLPKSLAALLMTEFRPVGKPCAKFVVFSKVVDRNFRRSIEEYKTVEEVQEGFRANRSTKRQITKLQCLLERSRRRGTISVMLYLDIKNAFNAINHRAMLKVLRACGYPEKDVELFRRMYAGTFLTVANQFGLSAACSLLRGVLQGAPTSPNVFNVAFNPIHVLVRACRRGCAPLAGSDPMGTSGFADDTTMHSDGPDAVPAMQVMVRAVAPFLEWLGLLLNMRKSVISAINHDTGLAVATDSITFNGIPFTVLPPDSAHKVLGVFMTLTGSYREHKEYVMAKMKKRCKALAEDDVIPRGGIKELAVTSGIVSIFRASAGVVPWTGAELDDISKLWIRAFKQAWGFSNSMDGSVIIVDKADGGRRCPSGRGVWTEDVMTVMDQCIQLPGEISAILLDRLRVACSSRGCSALSQMQKVVRVDNTAESIVELLALRLDEQGAELSTPWPPEPGRLILEVLWPQVWAAWRVKQNWKGCTEVSDEAREQWEQAKVSLKMCRMLGSVGILFLTQLKSTRGRDLSWEELRLRHCDITRAEYSKFISHLQAGEGTLMAIEVETAGGFERRHPISAPRQRSHRQLGGVSERFPPCIVGRVCSAAPYEQLELAHCPGESISDLALERLSDSLLLAQLCKTRAVFNYTTDGVSHMAVECLTPLSRVWSDPRGQEALVAQVLDSELQSPRIGVLGASLVRDLLKDNAADSLSEACSRPSWLISREDLKVWFPRMRREGPAIAQSAQLTWRLQPTGTEGLQQLVGLGQGILKRRESYGEATLARPFTPTYVWQTDPPLPSKIAVDLSNHIPNPLPAPTGWVVTQRNARVLVTDASQHSFGLDAAQYGMLWALYCDRQYGMGRGCQTIPTEQFLRSLKLACLAQRRADVNYAVPWNRHFITRLQQLTKAHLLVGPSAITYNPHFEFFASSYTRNEDFGSVQDWPPERALLLLDSIEPGLRQAWLRRAAQHTHTVWILRLHRPSMAAPTDLRTLVSLQARCVTLVPGNSTLLHKPGFWQKAEWDEEKTEHAAQIWMVGGPVAADRIGAQHSYLGLAALGDWTGRRYDFHWCIDRVPRALRLYRQHQQDALQYTFQGLVGGTDGSANERTGRMGAGFAVGIDEEPLMTYSASVGGPLAPLRAEAASLLQLLRRVRERFPDHADLLVFIDCLVLLDILLKWGRSDFQPQPRDVVHFDILVPLLTELRSWPGTALLVKVKSHAGCLQNERADALADLGTVSEEEPIFPGPSKYGTLWLRVRASWRDKVRSEQLPHVLPRDSAPNQSILKQVTAVNLFRAIAKRDTRFVRHLFRREEGRVLSRVVSYNDDAVLRVWIRVMTDTYPVQTYLHRIGAVKSPHCPHCSDNAIETLTHFACVCPKFREARTAAHNQLRAVVAAGLKSSLSEDWHTFEEKSLAATGLRLQRVQAAEVLLARGAKGAQEAEQDTVDISRWQPDFVLVSWKYKKIAILELTRPSDMLIAQMEEAYRKKIQKYAPILSALQHYIHAGWNIEILPWVVGIRGFVDTKHLQAAFAFLDIPKPKWKDMIEASVLASVRALAYMHKIRYSGANRRSAIDRGDLPVVHAKNCGKRRRPTTESMAETRRRWDNLADSIRRRSSGRAGSCSTPSILLSQLKNKKARESKGEG